VAVDLAVAWIANSDFANHPAVHLSMEDDALFFSTLLMRRICSP
jgi:hypothetical protein